MNNHIILLLLETLSGQINSAEDEKTLSKIPTKMKCDKKKYDLIKILLNITFIFLV